MTRAARGRASRLRVPPMAQPVALLLAALLLVGCSTGPAGTGASGSRTLPARADTAGVDVDTPALRALKQKAGIEPCPASTAGPVAAGAGLPDVTLPCLGGGRDVALAGLRGPMVVNLFAQWCGPCREELPYYQRLHEKAGDRLRVLGLDYLDTQPEAALMLARETGVTYPLVADPGGEVRGPLRARGLPGIVFVAADGTVAAVEYRVVSSYAELRDLVSARLGVRLPA
ncbi:MAG: TlpA disulfide reductase family protein [Nocardioidaceae bacterium]